jgi:hypothetical protein
MLDHMADANPEKAAVLGVFLSLSSLPCCSLAGLWGFTDRPCNKGFTPSPHVVSGIAGPYNS